MGYNKGQTMEKGSNLYLLENLNTVYEACETSDQMSAKRILTLLKENIWPTAISRKLDRIAHYLFEGNLKIAASEVEETMDVVWEAKPE